jgi:hypothetical protein
MGRIELINTEAAGMEYGTLRSIVVNEPLTPPTARRAPVLLSGDAWKQRQVQAQAPREGDVLRIQIRRIGSETVLASEAA